MSQRHVLASGFITCLLVVSASALITGEHGNRPVKNRGWPLGAEKVANLSSRLGYYSGPMGGGECRFLYRCKDATDFNQALEVFAAIRTPRLKLVVHDGPGHSHWLERDSTGGDARVDWTFTVWRPESWHRMFNNPKSYYLSDHPNFRNPVPPPTIDVHIGGGGAIAWGQVKVPPNVHVLDERAESTRAKPVGGGLVRVDVYDMATGQAIAGAEVAVARRKGRRDFEEVAAVKTDKLGAAEVSKIPPGRYDILARAEGYASRKQGQYVNDGSSYKTFMVELLPEASLEGILVMAEGKPIADAEVSVRNALGIDGLGYGCFEVEPAMTDAEGRFEIRSLPRGFTQLRCRAPTLHAKGLVKELYEVPSDDLKITMTGTGTVRVKVADSDGKPLSGGVHVHIQSAESRGIGSWGGAARCNEDGTFEFKGVPPGKYWVSPSPFLKGTDGGPDAKSVTVKAGGTVEVKVIGKPSRTGRPSRRPKPPGRPKF